MIFDFNAFTQLERTRGDELYLVNDRVVIEADRTMAIEPMSMLEKQLVPGYAITNRSSVGLPLSGGNFRYDAGFYAYLNAYAGFDRDLVTSKSYLLVNFEGLYELKYVESVRHYGMVFYVVYQLEETDRSKKLFEQIQRTGVE